MSIKHILVPIAAVDDIEPVAVSAMTIAHKFNGHVRFLFQRNGGEVPGELLHSFGALPMNQFSHLLESHRQDLEAKACAVRSRLDHLVQRHGLVLEDQPAASDGAAASWCETDQPITDVVGHVGGVSDLIVVGQPAGTHEDPAKTSMGAALFASGRPVLMIPDERMAALERKAVIGWNRSIQAGRGVSSALPFLQQAASVEIVSIVTGAKRGPSAQELAGYLSWHGVDPVVKEIPPERHRPVGDMLLDEAEAAGADLLVMGAYSHSRLRDMLWGGVTKHVATHAKLPVLMAH